MHVLPHTRYCTGLPGLVDYRSLHRYRVRWVDSFTRFTVTHLVRFVATTWLFHTVHRSRFLAVGLQFYVPAVLRLRTFGLHTPHVGLRLLLPRSTLRLHLHHTTPHIHVVTPRLLPRLLPGDAHLPFYRSFTDSACRIESKKKVDRDNGVTTGVTVHDFTVYILGSHLPILRTWLQFRFSTTLPLDPGYVTCLRAGDATCSRSTPRYGGWEIPFTLLFCLPLPRLHWVGYDSVLHVYWVRYLLRYV